MKSCFDEGKRRQQQVGSHENHTGYNSNWGVGYHKHNSIHLLDKLIILTQHEERHD